MYTIKFVILGPNVALEILNIRNISSKKGKAIGIYGY